MLSIDVSRMGPGFADAVAESQRSFRAILGAMAEPGTVTILNAGPGETAGLAPAAVVALLVLADLDTPVWLAPRFGSEAADYVRFHCGTPICIEPCEAQFAVSDASGAAGVLTALAPGDERYPDRSATLIVQCAALAGGIRVTLSGPGIRGVREVAPKGLDRRFWETVAWNASRYPIGVDLLLVSARQLMAIPRSTQLSLVEGDG